MTVYILTAQKEIETTISTYKHEIVTFVIKTFIGVYSDKKMALRDAKALKKKNLEKENYHLVKYLIMKQLIRFLKI